VHWESINLEEECTVFGIYKSDLIVLPLEYARVLGSRC
jgi:hypothetical protein